MKIRGRGRCHNRRPMIDKFVASPEAALADMPDGATVMIGGFGTAGMPAALIDALIDAGRARPHHRQQQRRQRRHRPRRAAQGEARAQDHLLVPAPGRLVALRRALPRGRARARAGAAGHARRAHPRRRRGHRRASSRRPATARELAEGKETRAIGGRDYVLEYPIHADFALIKADRADRWGNLAYRKTRAQLRRRSWRAAAKMHGRAGARDRRARRARSRDDRHARHLRAARGARSPRRAAGRPHDEKARSQRRWPRASRATSPKAPTSTSASACRRWSPTTCRRAARSSCTARTACSAWARRRRRARRTRT